jgi:serine/threonine protein kinase
MQSDRLEFLKEAAIMAQFDHPYVLGLLAVVIDKEPNMILTELMGNGALLSYLEANSTLPIDNLILRGVQVAGGMTYLANKGFVHRCVESLSCLKSYPGTKL